MADPPLAPSWLEGLRSIGERAASEDPLAFPGYREQLKRAALRAGTDESVVCGHARVAGMPVVGVVLQFAFLGGSMGETTGRRIVAAIDLAHARGVPLVTVASTGGARVQEGMRSLVQMQAVSAALRRLREAGGLHVAVAMQPTVGGVWASLVAAADVVIALDGAIMAFAGRRVRGDDVDGAAFTAAGKLESGAVDLVVDESDVGEAVGRCVRILGAPRPSRLAPTEPPAALIGAGEAGAGWEAVALARNARRPRAWRYLAENFDELFCLSGDRASGRDAGMLCGVGLRAGAPVAFVAQTGTANTPAGFRTAVRVLQLAERRGWPVLTLVDTPGAANDADAEREGIGTAIAQALDAFVAASVPVTSLVIGEGGSGGALAICDPKNIWAVPSSYFSVIAPEGAAAILWRDAARAREIAPLLRLAPGDLVELGIVRGVVAPGEPIPAGASA